MTETLRLEIVTPQGIAFAEDVEMVTLPASDEQLGSYPNPPPVIPQIVPGEIIVQQRGGERSPPVGKGVVETPAPQAPTATNMATPAEKIDEGRVEEARARAA